jgi:hypothetical protein
MDNPSLSQTRFNAFRSTNLTGQCSINLGIFQQHFRAGSRNMPKLLYSSGFLLAFPPKAFRIGGVARQSSCQEILGT